MKKTFIPVANLNLFRQEEVHQFMTMADIEFDKCTDPKFIETHQFFKSALSSFDCAFIQPKAHELTPKIKLLTNNIKKAYSRINTHINNMVLCHNTQRSDAAFRVLLILKSYQKLTSMSALQRHGTLGDLLHEFDKDSVKADLATVGADGLVEDLKTLYHSFDAMYKIRYGEQAKITKGLVAQKRKMVTAAYNNCVARLNALIEIDNNDAYTEIAEVITLLINHQRATILSRSSINKNKAKKVG